MIPITKFSFQEIKEQYPEYIEEYLSFLQDFQADILGKKLLTLHNGLSIDTYIQLYDKEYAKHISQILFPDHYISFYTSIQHFHSTKLRLCHFSGKVITIGEVYTHYRPLLIDETSNKKYVLDPSIILKKEYEDLLPTNFIQFENFIYSAEYDAGFEEFRIQYGEKITLKELNQQKKLLLK